MTKYVYHFREGNAQMRNLLGGKGANLAEMTRLGMPIPQGFTVTTEACNDYYANGGSISDEIKGQIDEALAALEAETGKKLGGPPCASAVCRPASTAILFMKESALCRTAAESSSCASSSTASARRYSSTTENRCCP